MSATEKIESPYYCENCGQIERDELETTEVGILFHTDEHGRKCGPVVHEDDDTGIPYEECAYYKGTGECSFGCWDEPRCVTG